MKEKKFISLVSLLLISIILSSPIFSYAQISNAPTSHYLDEIHTDILIPISDFFKAMDYEVKWTPDSKVVIVDNKLKGGAEADLSDQWFYFQFINHEVFNTVDSPNPSSNAFPMIIIDCVSYVKFSVLNQLFTNFFNIELNKLERRGSSNIYIGLKNQHIIKLEEGKFRKDQLIDINKYQNYRFRFEESNI